MSSFELRDQRGVRMAQDAAENLGPDQLAALAVTLHDLVPDSDLKTAAVVESMKGLSPQGQVDATVATVNEMRPEQQREVDARVSPAPPTSEVHRYRLWMTVIILLAVLALTSAVCSYLLAMEGKDFAAFIGLATAAVGGLIGMFSTSPTTPRNNG